MTPQQLIDLPSYGMAEKQLRKDGRWLLTPRERLDKHIDNLEYEIDAMSSAANAAEDIIMDMKMENNT